MWLNLSAIGTKRTSACALHMSAYDPKRTSCDLEDTLRIVSKKQRLGLFAKSEIIDTNNALACRPEWMVRAEQHFMSAASTHVVDKVPWISARLVRGSIDRRSDIS